MTKNAGVGKGWHGDAAAHAAAGRKGGQISSGNFKNDPERARAAGLARAEKRRQAKLAEGNQNTQKA